MLPALNDLGIDKVTRIINEIYNSHKIPEIYLHRNNVQKNAIYQTVSLMSHITKLIIRILINKNIEEFDQQ